MPGDNLVKILFSFYSEILEEETTEIMDALVVDREKGYFKINNIPFYAPLVASGDIVWAECPGSEEMLAYRKTIEHSGNSTIHVIVLDDDYDVDSIMQLFEEMGCPSEKINNYFALEIPAWLDYIPVKRQLDELEKEKVIDYAESWLSDKHQYKNISFG